MQEHAGSCSPSHNCQAAGTACLVVSLQLCLNHPNQDIDRQVRVMCPLVHVKESPCLLAMNDHSRQVGSQLPQVG